MSPPLLDEFMGQLQTTSPRVLEQYMQTSQALFNQTPRIVAQGFSQVAQIDYSETFAAVATSASSNLLLAKASREKLHFFDNLI